MRPSKADSDFVFNLNVAMEDANAAFKNHPDKNYERFLTYKRHFSFLNFFLGFLFYLLFFAFFVFMI